ncbi:MAG: NAD(P)/FAD-dependent oxidoreductase [Firmicutes bacterium]|nr:NAD(P)/FAD-dependent oxidoreductase [Bacillota bacterium]
MVAIKRDVIIAGAGPAGAICAAYLARAGVDVLLIDKELFPRDKACGDMLREGIVRHIEKLEAVDVLDEKSTCIRKIKLVGSAGSEAAVPFECYALPRFELDKLLVDTAKSWGAEVRQGCRLVDVIRENGKVCGVIVREKGAEYEIRSRFVIGADGVDSQLVKCLAGVPDETAGGIGEEDPDGIWLGVRGYFKGIRLDRSLTKDQYDAGGVFGFDGKNGHAYFWALPVGRDGVKRGLCNVGMLVKGRDAFSSKELLERLDAWMGSEKIKAMFDDAEQIGEWSFGRMADKTQARKCAGEGWILIGDAAAPAEPLFGDGLSAAADTAKAAADAVEAALKSGDFSAEAVTASYKAALAKLQPAKSEDEIKEDRLLMESLNDPHVMDEIVEMLVRDPNYAKKAL